MRSFTSRELDEVLSETKTDTAPRPDGFPVAFFKKFWPMLKSLVLQILNGFALGTVDISRLNFGILLLILKVTNAVFVWASTSAFGLKKQKPKQTPKN
jgi:hypothetical protein